MLGPEGGLFVVSFRTFFIRGVYDGNEIFTLSLVCG